VLVIGAEPVTPLLAQAAGQAEGGTDIAAFEQVPAPVAGQLAQAGAAGGGQAGASVNRSSGIGSGARNAHKLASSAAAGSSSASWAAVRAVAAASDRG
jgi:hypothetical protein